jgi:hypothetical protein
MINENDKKMTTITAKFRGTTENLKMFFTCGVRFESAKFFGQNNAKATFICEESNYQKALQNVMDCISLREADLWKIELESIA